MSTGSNIEWTDATWTPVKGCTRASEGCDHCYAVTMTHRLEGMERAKRSAAERDSELNDPAVRHPSKYAGLTVLNNRGERHFNGQVVCDSDALTVPLRWKKPRRVFVSSMSDIFHKDVPFEFIDRIFAVMALCPQHTFQVLTKRPERMAEYLASRDRSGGDHREKVWNAKVRMQGKPVTPMDWPLPNVWLGTSVESQRWADERIPHLLKCPAAVRFLSMEPLLGPVKVPDWWKPVYDNGPGGFKGYMVPGMKIRTHGTGPIAVDWVIVGGESGPKARPCDVAWIRSIVQQCKAAGVPCFVKQLGANVQCRNDHVSDWLDEVGMGLDFIDSDRVGMQGDPVRVLLRDRKGGDMAEWPSDLRVREMPGVPA